jgi:hypothetical protein
MVAPVLEYLRPVEVRLVPDNRPPAATWTATSTTAPPNQPMLLFEPPGAAAGPQSPLVGRNGTHASHLPDPQVWAGSLGRAMFEALHGRRPIGQLTRWVDDGVLSTIGFQLRSQGPRRRVEPAHPARLHSLRIQYPVPEAAEVCAHLSLGGRSSALAFRLEGRRDRWLCVALEFA